MIQWLYRYVLRGIGILLVIGVITGLISAISMQRHHTATRPAAVPAGVRR